MEFMKGASINKSRRHPIGRTADAGEAAKTGERLSNAPVRLFCARGEFFLLRWEKLLVLRKIFLLQWENILRRYVN